MKTDYKVIDIMKFIGSVMILTMHLNAFGDLGSAALIQQLLSRWGVPAFFLTSSYFLFSKSKNGDLSGEVLRAYLRRLGLLYLLWFLINLPNVFYLRLYGKDLLNWKTWIIFIKDSLLASSFTGSWYLVSSMFSALFVYLICKRVSTRTAIILSFILYLPCGLASVYGGLLPTELASVLAALGFPRNLFNGCLFFALGKYISEHSADLTARIPKKKSLLLAAVSLLIYLGEVYAARRFGYYCSADVGFALIPLAFFLFLFVLQEDVPIEHNRTLRKASTIIYCCQGNILLAKGFFNHVFGIHSSLILYGICCCLVAGIVAVILLLQKRTTWKWVGYLS